MLTMIAALASMTLQTSRHTLSTTIQPWSTAAFEVAVNGQDVLTLRGRETIDLAPYLRPGENTVEVRYRTDDGMPSLHQPALLVLETWEGAERKTKLRIAASLDNPRGKTTVRLTGR